MMTTEPPRPTSKAAFDEAWLRRCTESLVEDGPGIAGSLAKDPVTGTSWFLRWAPLPDVAACRILQSENRIAVGFDESYALVPKATVWTGERFVLVYPAGKDAVLGATLVAQHLELSAFVELAIGAAGALQRLHAAGHVHGRLRPSHMLVEGAQVRFTGFGGPAADGRPDASWDPAADPKSLPYLAPELVEGTAAPTAQSDLYALGVSLQQMLTGALPVAAGADAGWRHAQLAVPPTPASTQRKDVTSSITRVLDRLLRKAPAERYQSAASLLQDLHQCRKLSSSEGEARLLADVPPMAAAFGGSRSLVGRERQLLQLRGALDRVQHSGCSEVVLIKGGPGAGKSALAVATLGIAAASGLRTAAAKCDQQQLDIPFFALAEIVRVLSISALGEDQARLEALRQRWTAAVAGQGRAVTDLVPETESILGKTNSLANVPAQQAHVRMERVLRHTLESFALDHAPVVVFIDDLQWSDQMTRSFLDSFVVEGPKNVLLICAYRDQTSGGDALPDLYRQLVAPLHANRSAVVKVGLVEASPLSEREVQELLEQRLSTRSEQVMRLGAEIYRRTNGNPYFTHQLLQSLLDEGLLSHDSGQGWSWDSSNVRKLRYADSVVGLMVQRIARLPSQATEVAKVLACVGTRCEATLLGRACKLAPADTASALQPYFESGLIERQEGAFAFAHDRVLESVYSLVDEAQKAATHAEVAMAMMAHWGDSLSEHAFAICNQIERASGHEVGLAQKTVYVEALVAAARRAKAASAVRQAATYVESASKYMDETWWDTSPELAFEVRLLRCECLLAQADIARVEAEVRLLLDRSLRNIQRAALHRLNAVLHTLRSDYEKAIDAALAGLQLLGTDLKRHPTDREMRETYERVMLKVGPEGIPALAGRPPCTDVRVQTVMGLLATLLSSIFVRDGISFTHTAAMVELTIAEGVTPESAHGLAWFGVFVAGRFGAYKDGLDFGLAALELAERQGYEAERISALVAVDQVAVWTQPLEYALRMAQKASAQGLASGDVGMACYARNHIVSDELAMGQPLPLVMEDIAAGVELTREVQYEDIEVILLAQKCFVDSLAVGFATGSEARSLRASADGLVARANSLPSHFWTWLYHGMAAYHLGIFDLAVDCLARAEDLAWSAPGHINTADTHVYLALARAASDRHGNMRSGPALDTAGRLEACRERLVRWTDHNPGTFLSKLQLIEGELHYANGEVLKALAAFEKAAQTAAAAGFVHENALAHELASTICRRHEIRVAADQHLQLAVESYLR